jgi:hypothetical protein
MGEHDDIIKGLTRRELLTGLGAAAALTMIPARAQALTLDLATALGRRLVQVGGMSGTRHHRQERGSAHARHELSP